MFAILVCFSTSLPNGEYSNIFIAAGLSNKFFSGKTYFPVKNSYFPTFSVGKTDIKVVSCLNYIEVCFFYQFL